MYDYIIGTIKEKTPIKIVLDVNGIGYLIFIPINFFNDLKDSDKIKCFISFVVKEDSHTLYGFSSKGERDLFEMLKSTSGIGPKTALAIIGNLEFANFANAISTGNTTLISKIPGIGKKTAERLIIDLKDKIKMFDIPDKSKDMHIIDSINALINLGYNHFQAQKAIKKVVEKNKKETDIGTLISLALQTIR